MPDLGGVYLYTDRSGGSLFERLGNHLLERHGTPFGPGCFGGLRPDGLACGAHYLFQNKQRSLWEDEPASLGECRRQRQPAAGRATGWLVVHRASHKWLGRRQASSCHPGHGRLRALRSTTGARPPGRPTASNATRDPRTGDPIRSRRCAQFPAAKHALFGQSSRARLYSSRVEQRGCPASSSAPGRAAGLSSTSRLSANPCSTSGRPAAESPAQ